MAQDQEPRFPYERDGEDPGGNELSAALDITVALPVPGTDTAEQRIERRPRRDDLLDNLRGARRDGRPRPAYDTGRAGRSATRREDGLEAQPGAPRGPQVQREIERLKAELARSDAARAEAQRERDRAVRERDRITSERDQALRERDRAIAKAQKLADAAETRAEHRVGPGYTTVGRRRSAPGRAAVWAQRALAIGLLLIAVLALAITARVV